MLFGSKIGYPGPMVSKTAKLNVRMPGGIWWIVLLIVGCLNVGSNAHLIADPFYQGKRLTFMVDYSAGGPTDIECRLYIRHLRRHLAGKPTLVVRNRPGAGGVLAMNWLYERVRPDGTVAGCQTASPNFLRAPVLSQGILRHTASLNFKKKK